MPRLSGVLATDLILERGAVAAGEGLFAGVTGEATAGLVWGSGVSSRSAKDGSVAVEC